jgi:hypothetical protein
MRAVLGAALCLALAGCYGTQIFPSLQEQRSGLQPGDLEAGGVAFITPSTVTGLEQETKSVALTFAEVLRRERPAVRVITLADTLGAVNRAGLGNAYKHMYDDYRDTGLFSADVLRKVGGATGTRYVVQLKLQGFEQGSRDRFGIFGFRIVETKYAHIRVFLQVWDSRDSTIVWESMQELRQSTDTMTEEPVTLHAVLERSARDLVARLP